MNFTHAILSAIIGTMYIASVGIMLGGAFNVLSFAKPKLVFVGGLTFILGFGIFLTLEYFFKMNEIFSAIFNF